MFYYGSKISENIAETPEGFLITKNVPISRAGTYEYYGQEIGVDSMYGKKIKVHRRPEEVFSPASMSSFEGKPATNEHPKGMIDVQNVNQYGMGHMQNIRRDGDMLIADIVWRDTRTIDDIKNGKREVSCGYMCEWIPLNDELTEYEQRGIIGNHVALCKEGRAGNRVAIQDSNPESNIKLPKGAKRMKPSLKTLLGLGFKQYAADAEPDEIAAAAELMKAEDKCGTKDQEGEMSAEGQEMELMKAVIARLEALEATVNNLVESDKEVHETITTEDEFNELEKTFDQSEVIEPENEAMDQEGEMEEEEEEKEENGAAMDSKAFAAAKIAICGIEDPVARKAAMDSFKKEFINKSANNGYKQIVNNAQRAKKAAQDSNNRMTRETAVNKQVEAWNAVGQTMRGGK